MKFNVLHIISEHIETLKDEKTGKKSWGDLIAFYAIPVGVIALMFLAGSEFDRDSYGLSITFFGIFIALLLNIQVAIFSVYQRKWDVPPQDIEATEKRRQIDIKRRLLEQLNSNISYLILVACASIVLALAGFIFKTKYLLVHAALGGLYVHFLLTILMVVKRSHALFAKEYKEDL